MKTFEWVSISFRKAPAIVGGVAAALLFSTQMRNLYLAAVIGAIAAILFAGASGPLECAGLGLIAGAVVGPYVGVRMDLGAEIMPGWSIADAALPSLVGGAILTGLLCAGAGFLTGTFLRLYRDSRGPFFCIVFLLGGLLSAGCTPVPAGDQTPEPLSPTLPVAGIDPETEVVFTIANDEPAGGVAGEPVPDWLAWGAQAFTVATDGSFWILDTAAAHPLRLLQFSPKGALQSEIPLEGRVFGAVDVAVTGDMIWILGIAMQPAQVAAFDISGQPLETYPIPESLFEFQGDYVSNMLDDLRVGDLGELLLKGPTGAALFEFLNEEGELAVRQLDGYAFAGHVYRIEPPDLISVDDRQVRIDPAAPGGNVLGVELLGVRPDGGFYAAVTEEQVQDLQTTRYLRVVHAFALNGEHLGVSLPPESAVWVESNRDLAVGPDGQLYALVSREDHSVDVLRLGFAPELSVPPAPALAVSPVPLTPLLPDWATPPLDATDLEIARNTLLAFFTYLHDEKFAEAAALYGGPLDAVVVPDPESAGGDPGQFWEEACFLLQCLLVADIIEEEQIAPDEFRFLVEFMWDDGTQFVLGPCCGASEADMPPVWRFPYTVKEVAGRFVVMEPPQYVP